MTEQEDLELQIRTYDSNYRAGTPLCTDQVYDQLIEDLRENFPNSELLKKGVLTQTKQSRKEKLPLPMYSLNKCKSLEEIKQWMKSKGLSDMIYLTLTPKFDGISLSVNEYLKYAWTRGDGEFGQNSTLHFENLNGVGELCSDLYSFGEAIMSKKNFEKYRDKYANPRNLVAGLFNRDEPTEALQDVDYIRYGVSFEDNKSEQLIYLNKYFNEVKVLFRTIKIIDLTTPLLEELYQKWSEEYQIDGIVIDVEDMDLRKSLGREENMNPAYAIAYKNPEWSGSAIVKVIGITWQVSKQGKLKPVIQIEPTEVAGVVISNVTGYNAKYVFDNNIAEGSIIKIVRSGEVIPKHIETISWITDQIERLADELVECPCCGELTTWDETFTEILCTNPDCKDIRIAKLVHFFSTLEIEDFGEPSIRKLYDEAHFETIESILRANEYTLTGVSGWGQKSTEKLLNQFITLDKTGVPFAKFIHALDVMEGKVGEKTIQLICDNLSNHQIYGIQKTEISQLVAIDGVAEATAKVFLKGMESFRESIALPIEFTYLKTPKQEVVGDRFKDQKLCFTGCRPSKELEKEIQSQGGEVVSGVSSKTTTLVVKDMSDKTLSSSKAQKAKEFGIKIVTINTL